MSITGAWALSDTPSAYPIAIIYYYDVKLFNFDRNYSLDTVTSPSIHAVGDSIAASISDADTTHSPDGNSVFDALALKAPLASPVFTTQITTPQIVAPAASLIIKPTTDGTTAIQITDKDGNAILDVDTTNNRIWIHGSGSTFIVTSDGSVNNLIGNFELNNGADAAIGFQYYGYPASYATDYLKSTVAIYGSNVAAYLNIIAGGTAAIRFLIGGWNAVTYEKMRITSGGKIGMSGFTAPLSDLCVDSLHVGSETDAGANNLLVDGTINKVTVTAPATSATLTVADGKELHVEDTTHVNQDLTTDAQPTFAQLAGLGAPDANGEAIRQTAKITEALLESATDLKHAIATVSAPISVTGQALSLVNDAAAAVTEIDTGALANSDTVVPTSKAVLSNLPHRNIIINGGFTINQRAYVSAAALAAGVYGHDRWKGGAGGGTYSFTQLAGPTTITIAANKTLIQVIEDVNVYGGSYVLSWTGTCQARYAINSATPAGAYAASPIVITGQTAGTTMSVEFGNGAASGTLGLVQLELSPVVTPFEFRLYPQELALCQRYCQLLKPGNAAIQGFKYATKYIDAILTISPMRANPTLVGNDILAWKGAANPALGEINAYSILGSAYLTITGALTVSIQFVSTTSFIFRCVAATSFTGTDGDLVLMNAYSATAVLSAEL
jgi:hypothetical protein